MIALLLALASALAWAVSTLTGAYLSRALTPARALAWTMGIGMLVLLPFLAMSLGTHPEGTEWLWVAAAGVSTVLAFLCDYEGMRYGPAGLVGAIASTEGAVAALIVIAAGDRPSPLLLVAIPVLTAGLLMVMIPAGITHERAKNWPRALVFASLAAVFFGLSVVAAGELADGLPVVWAIVPGRLVGALVLTVPLAVMGRMAIPRRILPWAAVTALFDLGGFALYSLASRDDIAVAAIVSSQFGVLAAVIAAAKLHEHLTRRQSVGVGFVGLGIALVAAAGVM